MFLISKQLDNLHVSHRFFRQNINCRCVFWRVSLMPVPFSPGWWFQARLLSRFPLCSAGRRLPGTHSSNATAWLRSAWRCPTLSRAHASQVELSGCTCTLTPYTHMSKERNFFFTCVCVLLILKREVMGSLVNFPAKYFTNKSATRCTLLNFAPLSSYLPRVTVAESCKQWSHSAR